MTKVARKTERGLQPSARRGARRMYAAMVVPPLTAAGVILIAPNSPWTILPVLVVSLFCLRIFLLGYFEVALSRSLGTSARQDRVLAPGSATKAGTDTAEALAAGREEAHLSLAIGDYYVTDRGDTILISHCLEGVYYGIWHEQALAEPNHGMIAFNARGRHVLPTFLPQETDEETDSGHLVRPVTAYELKVINEEMASLDV